MLSRAVNCASRSYGRAMVLSPSFRYFATVQVVVPSMGESIRDGQLQSYRKKIGDFVKKDEEIVPIETDKVNVSIIAPEAGVISKILCEAGSTVVIGQPVVEIDTSATASAPQPAAAEAQAAPAAPPQPPKAAHQSHTHQSAAHAPPQAPAARAPAPTAAPAPAPAPAAKPAKPAAPAPTLVAMSTPAAVGSRETTRVPMTRMRQRIAQRLKDAQNTAAMLTTFNEIDMTNLIALRNDLKDAFFEKHGVKLGFMSAFVKASVAALQAQPAANAYIEGTDIVYNNFVDISVAVATPNGLVVPVLRNCESMSLADVEKSIHNFGVKARTGELTLQEMSGGTFTISNGGVFGSLFGTPIINPPQSAILGMHAVKPRPVAVGDKIEIRPMMYVALTYDHRLIDGREAVLCLRSIKEHIEDPRLALLDL